MRGTYLLAASLLLFTGWEQAQADTIVSNLNNAVGGQGSIYVSGPPQYYAQEFVVGSQSATLGTVIAALGNARGSFVPGAELVNNNNGQPGTTVLTSFAFPTLPTSGFANLTFTPNSSVTLSANTDYWFLLLATPTASSGSSDRYQWQYTNTNSSQLPLYASTNNGTTWEVESSGPFLIEVDSASSAATPEPSSLFLIGLAGLAFGGWQLRRGR